MGQGRGRSRCALWGGIALGAGTLAFALFSSSSAGCATNVVVLTHSTVTARGCAAFSVISHIGIGLIVLGAVLLLGSFALALRSRRQAAAAPVVPTATVVPAADTNPPPDRPQVPGPVDRAPAESASGPAATEPAVTEPVAPGPVVTEPVAPGPVAPGAATPGPVPPGAAARNPVGAIPVGSGVPRRETAVAPGSTAHLPPGWYGNPNNPDKPVQWWDGSKLTDRPE
jgi:hypothetical protein